MLGVAPKEINVGTAWMSFCFGGTKTALPLAEAVVFFNRELAQDLDYRCKQGGQLARKCGFVRALGRNAEGWRQAQTRLNMECEWPTTLESGIRNLRA